MINNETGEVSIGSDAPAGQVLITATCDALTASVTLTLEEGNSTEQTSIELAATLGKEYLISTMGSGITTFTGREITVTYDAALFEVIDLCAITYAKNLTSGQITHTEITITQFSPGVIKFKLDKTVPPGKTWSGVMNMIRLKAKATGGGIIQIF